MMPPQSIMPGMGLVYARRYMLASDTTVEVAELPEALLSAKMNEEFFYK